MNRGHATLTVAEASRLLASGAISREDLIESQRRVIRRHNGELNAFITLFPRDVRAKKGAPISGVTVAVKDNIYVQGHRTTAGSSILGRFVPSYDADIITRLRAAGAAIVGKTNLHEFAFGVTNINPHFGACRNPWKKERISGGSSGGSAVAVARGMTCAAVGSDTAGSVRIPAALCGVVGYKPTYGLISRRGVVPLAWSLDTVGFLTRSVADAAALAALTFDSGRRSDSFMRLRRRRLRGLRLGIPRNILDPLDEGVRKNFERSLDLAEGAGVRIVEVKLEHFKEMSACRSLIAHAEAASYHRQYISTRFDEYGSDLRRRLAQGLAIPAAVYLDAQRVRGALLDYYRSMFGTVDLLALPTTRIPAPTVKASKSEETEPGIRTALLALTEPFNLFGAPAISIPCGTTGDGLPVGFQLAGDLHCDAGLLSATLSFEELFSRTTLPA